ncbi:WXG100 family type VII secretion target [Actinokineospora cianjurensis]|uniref:WXG100 family type VII secretion target n=1 Tax=Actinokineospora cianjurensis TaxID=585224 RepID=A0A421B3W1_9PSEU|nr:WXG100 family type VII secretion target [Actinokineospora cianjurensis]RLK58968.1 WXG100 family type VII secretion target [Actinokineospora cianjurensis]
MTGMNIAGDTLRAHAVGSRGQAENFTGLARLLEQARVHDECFGPLGRPMAATYFTSLSECQDMAGKASAYLTQIAEALDESAAAYGATDTDNASGLRSAGQGVGSFGDLNSAGDANRDDYLDQVGNRGSTWADAGDKLQDAGSPAEAGFALVNARMEQLAAIASPGQALVDNGLGFLISLAISPLVEFVLEPAVGDPEQMRSTAKGWEKVSDWLEQVAVREQERAAATSSGWQGEAGDAFRAEMAEFAEGARALGGDIATLTTVLETAADIFDTFVQVVIDIIEEFVLGLIVEWLAALAASWITAGSSIAVQTGLTAAQVAVTKTRLGTKVADHLHRLKPLITHLEDALVRIRSNKIVEAALKKVGKVTDIPWAGDIIGRKLDRANPALGYLRNHTDDLATTTPNNIIGKRTFTEMGEVIRGADGKPVALSGEKALAQRVVTTSLGYLGLSGTTDIGRVTMHGVLENVPGAAVEWGLKRAEDHVEDPSTSDERRAAEDRGFTVD